MQLTVNRNDCSENQMASSKNPESSSETFSKEHWLWQARRQDFLEGGSLWALPKAVNRGAKC